MNPKTGMFNCTGGEGSKSRNDTHPSKGAHLWHICGSIETNNIAEPSLWQRLEPHTGRIGLPTFGTQAA